MGRRIAIYAAVSVLMAVVALVVLRGTWYLLSRHRPQLAAQTSTPPKDLAIERLYQDERGSVGKLLIGSAIDVQKALEEDGATIEKGGTVIPSKTDIMSVEKNNRLSDEGFYRGTLRYLATRDADDFLLVFGTPTTRLVQIHIRQNSTADWEALNTIDVSTLDGGPAKALARMRTALFGSANPAAFPEIPVVLRIVNTRTFSKGVAARAAAERAETIDALRGITVRNGRRYQTVTPIVGPSWEMDVTNPPVIVTPPRQKNFFDNVHDTIGRFGDNVHNTVGKAADDLHNTVGKARDDVHNTIGKAADDTRNTLNKAMGDARDTAAKGASDVHNTAGKATNDIHNTIGKAADDTHNTVGKAIDDVASSIEDIPFLGSLLEPWPFSQFHRCNAVRIVSKLSSAPQPPVTDTAKRLGWLTTPFKRIGISGWVNTGCTARASGAPFRAAQHSSDDFWTVDVKLTGFVIDGVYMPANRYIRLEIEPGTKAHGIASRRQLTEGDKLTFGGIVLVDSDGPFLEIHPTDDFEVR